LGPTDDTKVIEQDDDSGESRNSKITRDLAPGKYFLQVRHYDDRRGTGPYSISIVTARQIAITPEVNKQLNFYHLISFIIFRKVVVPYPTK